MSPKARDIKERINKWDLIKIKSFCMAKENSTKLQREPNRLHQENTQLSKYIRKIVRYGLSAKTEA